MLRPAEPEHKGIIERAHDYLERSFLPSRVFTGPDDFNTQMQGWLAQVNARTRRALGCAPSDRIGAESQAMLALPPVAPATGWRSSARLARDHYVRLDSNDYSVHPRRDRTADRGRRRPGPGEGALRGQRGGRSRTGLGLGTRPSPTRTTSRPPRCCAEPASEPFGQSAQPTPSSPLSNDLSDYDTALGIDLGIDRGIDRGIDLDCGFAS